MKNLRTGGHVSIHDVKEEEIPYFRFGMYHASIREGDVLLRSDSEYYLVYFVRAPRPANYLEVYVRRMDCNLEIMQAVTEMAK